MKKRKARSVHIFILFWILLSIQIYAQSVPRVRLTGTVIDVSTGAPLHFANVFLSNTMKGAATDKEGRFSIVNVPLGTYELIASMIGYETEVIKIKLTESREYVFQIKLKPKAIEAPSIEVTGRYPKEWRKQLKRFQKLIFGDTENAKYCKILNPELLSFDEDKSKDTFVATAEGPLKIENRALGYRITLHLQQFNLNNESSLLNTSGHLLFKALNPENKKEEKKWKENRIRAYKGSIRHFFNSVVSNTCWKDGFQVRNTPLLTKGYTSFRIDISEFISKGERPYERKIFFQDYLEVSYSEDEWADKRHRKYSWLKIARGIPITINTWGLAYNNDDMTQYGFWAQQRLADELPWDYMPEED